MTYSLSPHVEIINGVAVTTSLAVAEYFGKLHKNILRSIELLDCSEEFSRLNFELTSYLDQQGKSRPMYYLTKNGFVFLVMGFTGEEAGRIKEAYITAFDQMETQLREQPQLSSGIGTSHWINRCMELQEELLQLYRKQIVQKRPRRRLTIDAIGEIQLLHAQGFSPDEIIGITGHDESTITYVINLKYPNQS
jgi:Rha family phage regulatory protein